MRALETEVELFGRRISRIKANPDPRKSRCNLLYYEMQYDRRKNQVEAWKAGAPIVDCAGQMAPLVRAMGLEPIDYGAVVERLAATGGAAKYFDRIRQIGLTEHLCDRTILFLPMVLDGDLAKPSFTLTANAGCEAMQYSSATLSRYYGVPHFNIDVPFFEPSLETLDYVTGQIQDLIGVMEAAIPGCRYDEDRMIQILEHERIYCDYLHDIYLARKHVPCPEAPQDVFRIPPMPSDFPHAEMVVDYGRARRDEVLDRATRGVGGVKHENLRIMWTNTAPHHANVFDLLAERGVSILFFLHGHAPRVYGAAYGNIGDEEEFGKKLSPLEEQARLLHGRSWGGLTARWNRILCKICRDLDIDAIVDFQQTGCVQIIGWQKLMDEAVARELGIPMLHIGGRMLDVSDYDPEDFTEKLMGFLDLCIEKKPSPTHAT